MRRSTEELSLGRKSLEAGNLVEARQRFIRSVELLDINFHGFACLAILDLMEKDASSSLENFQKSLENFDAFKALLIASKSNHALAIENLVARLQSDASTGDDPGPEATAPDDVDQETILLDRASVIRGQVAADSQMVYPAYYRLRFGELLFTMSDFDRAKQQYQLAVEADPEAGDAWAGLSLCWFIIGDCKEAKSAFVRASQLGAAMNPSFEADLLARCGE